MVFDFEQSKALVKAADNYLDGLPEEEESLLALPAPDAFSDLNQSDIDETKSLGGASQMTKLSDRNFVDINKSAAGRTRFMLGQRVTDRLSEDQRAKLDEIDKEIDDNLEAIM